MKFQVVVKVTTKGVVTKKYIREIMKSLEKKAHIEKIVVPVIKEA